MALRYDWDFLARPEQREPTDPNTGEVVWLIWLIVTGRGWGKTRTGAETVRKHHEAGRAHQIALVAPTAADTRDVMLGMNPESSGLLQVCPPWDLPLYEPSKRRAIWPNGDVAILYSAEEPGRLRGPQHDMGWGDEPAEWSDGEEVLSNLEFGLRLGDAKLILTGTPKPTPFIKSIMKRPGTILTTGSMRDNPNLSPVARDRILARYAGTRTGLQEIEGMLLEDNPNALWTWAMIDENRISLASFNEQLKFGLVKLKRIVVAIDPAVTNKRKSNSTGITVSAIDDRLLEPHAYVIKSISVNARPESWARTAINLYHEYNADRVIGETNNGGDLIESTLRQIDPNVSYHGVTASRGKMVRAEPVSALYEQGRVHHIGMHKELETQQTEYTGVGESPDEFDSCVWSLTELVINKKKRGRIISW